jgi:hypothetical protein
MTVIKSGGVGASGVEISRVGLGAMSLARSLVMLLMSSGRFG